MKINFKHFLLYLFIIITSKESCIYSNQYPDTAFQYPVILYKPKNISHFFKEGIPGHDTKIAILTYYIDAAIQQAQQDYNKRKHYLSEISRPDFEGKFHLRPEAYLDYNFDIYTNIYWLQMHYLFSNNQKKETPIVFRNHQRLIPEINDIINEYDEIAQTNFLLHPSAIPQPMLPPIWTDPCEKQNEIMPLIKILAIIQESDTELFIDSIQRYSKQVGLNDKKMGYVTSSSDLDIRTLIDNMLKIHPEFKRPREEYITASASLLSLRNTNFGKLVTDSYNLGCQQANNN